MRKQTELLGSRTRVEARYALIPLDGIPLSRLPAWPDAEVQVLAAPALGAQFAEYRIHMPPGTGGAYGADGETEHFLFVLDGAVELGLESGTGTGAHRLDSGGYALIPPSAGYRVRAAEDTTLLLLRKRYEPLPEVEEFEALIGSQQDVRGEVYMGDEGALLQSLVPKDFSYDLAMNIFTFETGHSLPVTETHVMEHGLYVLAGKGLYYLGGTWMEVRESDFIWMGPFCPQSYYATGPEPTRYIYYKNVNREIPL
ncbi:MAG: (S)-ureidoglycine aminohydrolase [Spirochaetes bacterium]|jgi:(S)-ureidoglycine aminohydrolase|nr:(S)-ureidoglycine aminohydrolase [Spirochaetota bacterium]